MTANISRAISYYLRHHLDVFPNVDSRGAVPVQDLINELNNDSRTQKTVTISDIQDAVDNNDKQRFTMEDGMIWARQGHSRKFSKQVDQDALLTPLTPELLPQYCTEYVGDWWAAHGTNTRAAKEIMRAGLSKRNRMHIHMAQSDNANQGYRKGANVCIWVNVSKALADGIPFYVSDNNVVLSPGDQLGNIPPKYLKWG